MPSVRDLAERRFAQKNKEMLLLHRASVARPNDESLSYFGGLPRLPPDWPWPEVSRRNEDGPGDGRVHSQCRLG